MSDGRVSAELFSAIASPRASAEVVRQIRAAVENGQLSPGDRLPPERELATQLGVSRVTVRDALRALEADGLVTIRVGAGGGAFVTTPRAEHLQRGLDNLLLTSALTAAEVTEARVVFELGALDLVCDRATDEDLEELEAICDRAEQGLEDGDFDVSLSAEFHVRLARASHNRAVELITEAFQRPILHSLVRAKLIDPHPGDAGIREHRDLVAAVRDRDPVLARSIMATHLARTADRVRDDAALIDGGAADNGQPTSR
ncbi:FadR/GntR family transcriptional regulator [Egicoccus sp. AB-alg2]|uniref:FadR/GntR family transcriptional regulator n=1 Tax=Egicoccus sp. AB-alg2 TaxID=3242693 RepID=UPI00359CE514